MSYPCILLQIKANDFPFLLLGAARDEMAHLRTACSDSVEMATQALAFCDKIVPCDLDVGIQIEQVHKNVMGNCSLINQPHPETGDGRAIALRTPSSSPIPATETGDGRAIAPRTPSIDPIKQFYNSRRALYNRNDSL